MAYGHLSTHIDSRVQSGLVTPLGAGITSTFSGISSTFGSFGSGYLTSLSGIKTSLLAPGWKTGIQSGSGSSADLDLRKIGQARNAIMDIKLNQVIFLNFFATKLGNFIISIFTKLLLKNMKFN